jgi:hypothetical protein
MKEIRSIVSKLGEKIPLNNKPILDIYHAIKVRVGLQYIPHWYMLNLKGLCHIYDIPGVEDYKIPNEIHLVKIFYALEYKEIKDIVGHSNHPHYVNRYCIQDEGFVYASKRDFFALNNYYPEYAVVYSDELWFIGRERFELLDNQENIEDKLSNIAS